MGHITLLKNRCLRSSSSLQFLQFLELIFTLALLLLFLLFFLHGDIADLLRANIDVVCTHLFPVFAFAFPFPLLEHNCPHNGFLNGHQLALRSLCKRLCNLTSTLCFLHLALHVSQLTKHNTSSFFSFHRRSFLGFRRTLLPSKLFRAFSCLLCIGYLVPALTLSNYSRLLSCFLGLLVGLLQFSYFSLHLKVIGSALVPMSIGFVHFLHAFSLFSLHFLPLHLQGQ